MAYRSSGSLLTLCLLIGGALHAGLASAALPQTVSIDPQGTYFVTHYDPPTGLAAYGSPKSPTRILLSSLGVSPGAKLRLTSRGEFNYSFWNPSAIRGGAIARFTAATNSVPLNPPPSGGDYTLAAPILNCPDLSLDPGATATTYDDANDFDLPKDVAVTITVPSGATAIEFGTNDCLMYDNRNTGDDFRVNIESADNLTLAVLATGPELRLVSPPLPTGKVVQSYVANCTQNSVAVTPFANSTLPVPIPLDLIDTGKAYVCDMTVQYTDITFSAPSNKVEVAIDCDQDGVPDDWEKNGILLSDGTRLPVVSRQLNASGVPINASGGNTASCTDTDTNRRNARDVWLWIDQMAGLSPSQYVASESALVRIARSFQRQGITLHWWFGPNRVANVTGVDLGPGLNIANASHKAVNLFTDPATGTPSPTRMKGRDLVFRYFLWGNRFSFPGCTDLDNQQYCRNSGISLANRGVNYNFVSGAKVTQSLDSHTGVLMHELGHALGLGHGGPWYASEAAARSRTLWSSLDPLYEPGRDNYKPNHLSVMNYSNQSSGLLHFDGRRRFDYNAYAFDDVDERALGPFWLKPLAVGGVQNLEYGIRVRCRPVGTLAELIAPTNFTVSQPGEPASCAVFFASVGLGALPFRPTKADVNWARDTDPISLKLLRVKPDWANLRFSLAFMGDSGAANASTLGTEEPPASQLDLPLDYKHQLEIFDDPQVLSLAAGQIGNISIRLKNRGFANDSFALEIANSAGWAQSASATSLAVAAGAQAAFVVSVTAPATGAVGATTKLSIKATSVAQPQNDDDRELVVSIASSAGTARLPVQTPPALAPAQDFLFPAQTNIKLDSYVESNTIALVGLTSATELQVRGAEYAINGGAWQATVSDVQPGDNLRLRLVSASFPSSTTVGQLLVGGQRREFRATTRPCSLDVDGNGAIDAVSDGILILRYLLGFRGAGLITGVIGQPVMGRQFAARSDAADVELFLDAMLQNKSLDVDGDTRSSPMTDGLMILRAMLGAPMPSGAIAADVLGHLRTQCDLPL